MTILIDRKIPRINTISDAVTPKELYALTEDGIIKTTTTIKGRSVTVYGFKYNGDVGYSAIYANGTSGGCFGLSEIISLIQQIHDEQ